MKGVKKMREQIKGNAYLVDFDSINDFCKYIKETDYNRYFCKDSDRTSKIISPSKTSFTQTKTFEEAEELLRNGWPDMSKKLTQRLKQEEGKMEPVMIAKNVISVQGYQPIVPLYLNNVPNNMVSKKMSPVKQKVMTLNKSVSYSASVSSDKIIDESIKAFRIIKKFESQNFRCNLNIVMGTSSGGRKIVCRVRVKSANEKLNISKLAFPLVHPSMLRRLLFRFIEVYPNINSSFVYGYGMPMQPNSLKEYYDKEYILPQIINVDIEKIRELKDLENL